MFGLTLAACLQASLLATAANPGNAAYDEAYHLADDTGRPLVVLVGTDWCPGCVKMKQNVIPQLREMGDLAKVAFVSVNVDSDRELAGKLMQGGTIPQFIVFHKTPLGWQREQFIGAKSVSETQAVIQRALESPTTRLTSRH